MEKIYEIISILSSEPYKQIALSLSFIVILILSKWILVRVIERQVSEAKIRFRWKKTVSYTLTFIGIILIGRVWFSGITSITTYIGLLSAGLAIALKDMLTDLAGWVFILWRKPFEVGNRIQLGEHSGDVIDIRPFQFTILEIGNWVNADQSTGRMVHIPNGLIFAQPLSNYDYGFKYIWNEIPVMITFDSDWEKAKQVLSAIADEHALPITKEVEREILKAARQFLIVYQNLTPKVYTSVADSGIVLTIRYLTEIRQRRGSSEEIWEAVLREFTKADNIALAYPTYRITPDSGSELKQFTGQ